MANSPLKEDAFKEVTAAAEHNAQNRQIEFEHNTQIIVKREKELDSCN